MTVRKDSVGILHLLFRLMIKKESIWDLIQDRRTVREKAESAIQPLDHAIGAIVIAV